MQGHRTDSRTGTDKMGTDAFQVEMALMREPWS